MKREENYSLRRCTLLTCRETGEILDVIREDFALHSCKIGSSLLESIDDASEQKAQDFLQAILHNGVAVDWSMYLKTTTEPVVAHFGGTKRAGDIFIVAAERRSDMFRAIHDKLEMESEKGSFGEGYFVARLLEALERQEREPILYDEITRIGNELTNAYRELARKNAETERAIEFKDRILSVIAHDLRNPLNGITLTLDVLEAVQFGTPPERLREMTARIRASTTNMERLISDLLDAARIESGRIELQREQKDIEDVLRSRLSLHASQATRKQIRLEFERAVRLPLVDLDETRLGQAFDNILGNAIKFAPISSKIVIQINRVEDQVQICIRDQGPGIPPAEQSKIFVPFITGSTESSQKGAGLGLAIARGAIEAHGGRLWLESSNESGSVFCMSLPILRS